MSEMIYDNGRGRVALADLDTAGGLVSLANPLGKDVYVTRVIADVKVKATGGTLTADGGIAANGTTKVDNLIDGVDFGTAIGVFDNIKNGGSNGKAGQKWGADQFFTLSMATGAAAGLEGEVIIEWAPLSE